MKPRLRAGLVPLEHDLVTTFEVTRGSFEIPADVLGDDDDLELRRLFARSLPERGPAIVITTKTTVRKDGGATVTWRRVRARTRRA